MMIKNAHEHTLFKQSINSIDGNESGFIAVAI